MNNLKKVGLTALAGSLVATSVYAGSLSVSGSAAVKYQSRSGSNGGTSSVQGNPWSDSNGITFSGGGELDNGMTVGVSYTMTDAAFSTSNVTLDMGDSGKLAFGHDQHMVVLTLLKIKYQLLVKKYGWYRFRWRRRCCDIGSDHLCTTQLMLQVLMHLHLTWNGTGTENSIALVASELMDGEFGIGTGTNVASATSEDDYTTVYGKYTSGAFTIGVQLSKLIRQQQQVMWREAAAISFAVNENLSISYGMSTVKYESSSKVDEKYRCVSFLHNGRNDYWCSS